MAEDNNTDRERRKERQPVTDEQGNTLFSLSPTFKDNDGELQLLDEDWVTGTFMVASKELDYVDKLNRYWSNARRKFTDTSAGGNIGINARPQFTRYSDIRLRGRLDRDEVTVENTGSGKGFGMGRYYSESLDDNTETLYMEFGVGQHSNIARFLGTAIDPSATIEAALGKALVTGGAAAAIGNALKIWINPIIGTIHTLGEWALGFAGLSSSKYYKFKPAMYQYWSMVNNLVNQFAVELGITPYNIPKATAEKIGDVAQLDQESLDQMRKLFPEIYGDKFVDVFAIANRAQVLAYEDFRQRFEQYDGSSEEDPRGFLVKSYDQDLKDPARPSFANYLDAVFSFENWFTVSAKAAKAVTAAVENAASDAVKKSEGLLSDKEKSTEANVTTDSVQEKQEEVATSIISLENPDEELEKDEKTGLYTDVPKKSFLGQLAAYTDATLREGAAFAVFKVNFTGSHTLSYSNTTQDSAIKSVLHTVTDGARAVKFNLGGLNLGDNAIGNTINTLIGEAVGSAAIIGGKLTYGLSNVLLAALGGGYIDVPKRWADSSVSIPSVSYKMDLVAPYNHPISLLQNIYIPMAMIMAGSLPRAVGKNSYTSPFYCTAYNRGRQIVKFGIISNVSITRGITNLPFAANGRPLGVSIDFTVEDLSSVMSVPIDGGGLFSNTNIALDEDHLLSTFIATATGRDLYSLRYLASRAAINYNKRLAQVHSYSSAARWGMMFGDSAILQSTVGPFVFGSSIVPAGNRVVGGGR